MSVKNYFYGKTLNQKAFTVVELLVVLVIIGVLIGLLLPSMRGSHEAARRMSCGNNFKQLGLAMHNYHAAYNQLPSAMGGTDLGSALVSGNENRLSGLIAMLPFFEQQKLWEEISSSTKFKGVPYPAMGPTPWTAEYTPWRTQILTLQCPSAICDRTGFGVTNYTFCIGDMARGIHEPTLQRGVFTCRTATRFKAILDGTANTIAMAEIGTPVGPAVIGQFAIDQATTFLDNPGLSRDLCDPTRPKSYLSNLSLGKPGRGGRWADGAAGYSLVNTILPPNSPSVAIDGVEAVDGIYSAGSFHQGGCHVLMADGAVKFITDSIDAGNQSLPTLTIEQMANDEVASPYGLWGALGTASSKDEIKDAF